MLAGEQVRLICSPLGRCRESARLIAPALGVAWDRVQQDERLKELCYGTWQGRTIADIQRDDYSFYEQRAADLWNTAPPEGETYRDASRRLSSWLRSLTPQTTVVVGHGCSGRILRAVHVGNDSIAVDAPNQSHDTIVELSAPRQYRELDLTGQV